MNKVRTVLMVAGIATLMSACTATAPVKEVAVDPYPNWYYSPSEAIPNALSTASCAAIPAGNMEVARKKALVNGRADLAAQIETRVKAMDKAYSTLASTEKGDLLNETFETVTKQVSNQTMSGVRAIKSTRVTDGGKQYFCSLISLDPAATKGMIDAIFKAAGSNLSADEESILRARFMAEKAQAELENAF
ncbi:MAG: hypothetical protein ACI93R_000421 [Flavobacteriales bacterium]|jgi:hypothetical protein